MRISTFVFLVAISLLLFLFGGASFYLIYQDVRGDLSFRLPFLGEVLLVLAGLISILAGGISSITLVKMVMKGQVPSIYQKGDDSCHG